MSRCSRDCCYKYTKRRLPILSWARNYKLTWLPQDALAGFTVGLTAIPQGIAYAIVADLSPENLPGRRTGTWSQKIAWATILARNALVVIVGTLMAYIFSIYDLYPFNLTGSMGHGLPPFGLPKFNAITNDFFTTAGAMGMSLVTVPIVSTIEHMAIAKAFAKGKSLDGTQEMLALGLCNIGGSLVRSMPVTGSFTRTAVNNSSGVKTTFGGLFTGALVLLAAGLLTSTFRFIPKATLAGVIICSMYYMLDFKTYALLWRAKKIDFFLMLITLLFCVFLKLEWGIIIGISLNLAILLYFSARPSVQTEIEQVGDRTVIRIIPDESITFPAAEHFRAYIMKLSNENSYDVVLDCRNLKRTDVTVAKNLKLLANDLGLRGKNIIYENCQDDVESILQTVIPDH